MKRLYLITLILMLVCASVSMGAFRPSTIGDVFHKGMSGYDARAYGAKGDGSTDDAAAFTSAVTAAANNRLIVSATGSNYVIDTNTTISDGVDLVIRNGAILEIGSGVTLAINGTSRANTRYSIPAQEGRLLLPSALAIESTPYGGVLWATIVQAAMTHSPLQSRQRKL